MVDGHELHEEDLRLMYTFNQASGSTAQYEAHSDSQVRLKQEHHFRLYSSFSKNKPSMHQLTKSVFLNSVLL